MKGQACVNGSLVPAARAVVSVFDDGLLRGDGVYEVLRLYGGRPFALDEHIARLRGSAERLRIPMGDDLVRSDVEVMLSEARGADCCLRIILTSGSARILFLEALETAGALRLAIERHRPTPLLSEIKSLSYAANMRGIRLARERGFDDVLLITPEGTVLEAATASLFWFERGDLFTPPLRDGILDSITRRWIMRLTECREETCQLSRVAGATEVFLASTRIEVAPVVEIESAGSFEPGRLTEALARSFHEQVQREIGDGPSDD